MSEPINIFDFEPLAQARMDPVAWEYIRGRRGADISKAVALGARAACIGCLYLWGLAADGERGVARVIEILRYEFDTAMGLTGKRSVAEVDSSVIWKRRG